MLKRIDWLLLKNITRRRKQSKNKRKKYFDNFKFSSKLRTEEFDRNQKNHRDEIAQLKQIHFTEIEKLLKEEEAR